MAAAPTSYSGNVRKHWLAIVVCAAVGLAINAWISHYCLLHHSPPFSTWPHFSAQWYWNRYAEGPDQHGPARFHHVSSAIGCDFLIIDAAKPDIGDGAPPRMMITRAGFPLRSFEGMHSWGGVQPSHSWAIPIEPRDLNVAWVSVIPCKPLLLGFIGNTALYGLLVWICFAGPGVLLKRIKAERWRLARCCHQCGYDLRGALEAGCPECGWRRESSHH